MKGRTRAKGATDLAPSPIIAICTCGKPTGTNQDCPRCQVYRAATQRIRRHETQHPHTCPKCGERIRSDEAGLCWRHNPNRTARRMAK